ncbi:9264_t:CDS:2 [Dentiscutata heterogama]|uniref:9264_t:CDS:1 n=1 Tax=Dentiscutata heterogama TaxID=1316150 RepID=A0ACA9MWU9_9GLOM|nr:9264_t:CDS:2 [Dentiscutata heterogama]
MDESFDEDEKPTIEQTDIAFDDDEDEGDLDMSGVRQEAWIAKLPSFLFEKWADISEDDLELAKVQVYSDPYGGPDQYKLILADHERHDDIPKEYELDVIGQQVQNNYCFCEDRKINSVSLSSTVTGNFNIRPSVNADYSKKLRERTLLAAKPERTIRFLEENENRGAYVPPGAQSIVGDKFSSLVPKKPKVTMEQKTTRIPKNELIDSLFGAFEKYAYWTFKGLKDYVKQPESYLKEVLNEIAILDKKGHYNNCYHLKPEYSQNISAETVSVAPQGVEAPLENVGNEEDYSYEALENDEFEAGSDDDLSDD